jgi:hypothetical protein
MSARLDREKADDMLQFGLAIKKLPQPPSAEAMEDGATWPDYSTQPDGISEGMLPFVNEQVSAFFRLLPASGRLLYMKSVLALAPANGVSARAAFTRFFGSQMNLPRELDAEMAAVYLQGGESNVARHLCRWVYLMTTAVCMLLALEEATKELAIVCEAAPDQSVSAPWPFSRREYAKRAADQVTVFSQQTTHPFLTSWDCNHPGMLRSSPVIQQSATDSDSSNALQFLGNQLKIARSVYHFPKISDSQRNWEDWFFRISALQTMFARAPANHIIAALMGTIQSDDRRVYGWHDKMMQMRHEHREPGLDEFITHVRRQVMRTNTTRRTAHVELSTLSETLQDVDDCLALSTKLRQLWAQLFPTETDEVEPISRLNAAKLIHKLLEFLKFRGNRKHEVVLAWKAYTTYDGLQMFMEFLDEQRHTPLNTEELSAKYVSRVCEQLEIAHRIHTQTQDLASASASVNKSVLAAATPKRAPVTGTKKRGRSVSGGGGGQGESRPKSQQRQDRGGNTPQRQSASANRPSNQQSQQTPATTTARALREIAEEDPQYNVGTLRTEFGLPRLSLDKALAAINDGACIVCAEAKHGMSRCPHRVKGSDASKDLANNLVSRWRGKMYPGSSGVPQHK